MKRSFDAAELEMMDRPQAVSAELERDLRNLQQLNKYFGSYRLVLNFVHRWIKPGEHVSIDDQARAIGAPVEIDALDQQGATLEIARKLSANYPEISYVEANILEWDPDAPYDIVLCSLALHHFSDEDAVRVLKRCRELSRRFVLVSDLRRGLLLAVGVYLLTAFVFREPMTRYDGRLSAARAFSFGELRELAHEAGWQNFGQKRFRFGRQGIWLE